MAACRERGVTPHVAANVTRQGGSAIDGRTTRHEGYAISQVIRKRIEEHFGWAKTVGRAPDHVPRDQARRSALQVDHDCVESGEWPEY